MAIPTEAAHRAGRVYHAGKSGLPMCGQRGTGNRINIIVLSAKDWNATPARHRCTKCVEANRARKSAAEARAND